jgi:hypothetical protein
MTILLSQAEIDYIIGKRIRLIHTDDRYTELVKGDEGEVVDVHWFMKDSIEAFQQIDIDWDNHSTLMLLGGDDKFEVIK